MDERDKDFLEWVNSTLMNAMDTGTDEQYDMLIGSLSAQYRDIETRLPHAAKMERPALELHMEVIQALVILFKSLVIQQRDNPELNHKTVWHTRQIFSCMSIISERMGRIHRLDENMERYRSAKNSSGRRAGHVDANMKRAELRSRWETYVRERVSQGYNGSAPALVANSLRLPQFNELRKATETRYTSDGNKTNAFIQKRKLEDFVRVLQKEFSRS